MNAWLLALELPRRLACLVEQLPQSVVRPMVAWINFRKMIGILAAKWEDLEHVEEMDG